MEGNSYPLRLLPGTRSTTGTSADVTAANLTITGGGLSGALVFVNSGTVLRLINPQFYTAETAVRGVQVQRDAAGVDANTRLEITGGRIAVPGAAIFVTGGGTSFSPKGRITGLDASDSNAGAWPFVNQNSGTFNEIEITGVLPKQATTNGLYYAGCEHLIANATQTALPNGSKGQRVFLQAAPVADPYSPNGTYNFGTASSGLASRISMAPYLTVVPLENGAGVHLLRDTSTLVWNEVGRSYPVHQNKPMLLSFTAAITVGTSYYGTPLNYRMPAYGRIQSYRVRFSNPSAARTAGSITITATKNGSTLTYPIRAYRDSGVDRSPADTPLTFDLPYNSITLTGVAGAATTWQTIPYDVENPSAVPYGETLVVAVGEGRDLLFAPVTVPDAPLSDAYQLWIVFTGFGLSVPMSFEHEDGEYPATVDLDAWTARAAVSTQHTEAMTPGSWGTIDLVYGPESDDRTILRRKLARVVK